MKFFSHSHRYAWFKMKSIKKKNCRKNIQILIIKVNKTQRSNKATKFLIKQKPINVKFNHYKSKKKNAWLRWLICLELIHAIPIQPILFYYYYYFVCYDMFSFIWVKLKLRREKKRGRHVNDHFSFSFFFLKKKILYMGFFYIYMALDFYIYTTIFLWFFTFYF